MREFLSSSYKKNRKCFILIEEFFFLKHFSTSFWIFRKICENVWVDLEVMMGLNLRYFSLNTLDCLKTNPGWIPKKLLENPGNILTNSGKKYCRTSEHYLFFSDGIVLEFIVLFLYRLYLLKFQTKFYESFIRNEGKPVTDCQNEIKTSKLELWEKGWNRLKTFSI